MALVHERSFTNARSWAQSLGLKSENYWRQYRKEGLPEDVPSNPNREYADEWEGWGDWLGTGRVADKQKKYRSYKAASNWAKSQGITKLQEWRAATKKEEFPKDIPVVPNNTYKDEWTNWGEFLQTGYVHYKERKRANYEEAKAWAKQMNILRKEDWDQLSSNGLMPPEIPANISKYYKEWKSWSDFLDNQIKGGASITEVVIGNELRQFLPIDDSIRSISLKNGKSKRIDIAIPNIKLLIEYDGAHWHKPLVDKDIADNANLKDAGWNVLRIREKPLEIIGDLDVVVNPKSSLFEKVSMVISQLIKHELIANSEFVESYLNGKKLSFQSVGLQSQNWLPYRDAKQWVAKLALKSEAEWRGYKKKSGLPANIPAAPEDAYKTEWKGWGDFLSTGNVAPFKNMQPFAEARAFARALNLKDSRAWRAYVKAAECPRDIPSNPDSFYAEWKSWMDWLGTEDSAKRKRSWLSFEDACVLAKSLGLKSESDWRRAKKAKLIPVQLPAAPEQLYKAEWKGWGYWLGTGNVKNGDKAKK
jgi:hypothetical protein